MTTIVFGDFLRPAGEHISAAVFGADDLRDDAQRSAIRELGRASATLARYFADLIPPKESGPARSTLTVERRALLEARAAMRRAASNLGAAVTLAQDAFYGSPACSAARKAGAISPSPCGWIPRSVPPSPQSA